MIRSVGIAVIITVCMLWGFSALMNSAIADVTGAGSTTNTQSTSGSSATNTAITGGYHSEATTNYQSGSSSNTTTNNETTNNAYTGDQRVVPSSAAPSLSNMSQDVCSIAVVGGIQKFGLGISAGTSKRDINCERLKLAKALHDMNMRVASIALLCQNPMVFEAMAHAGTSCPFLGAIGTDAEAKWKEYPQLRPDYEEYTKNLKYTTRIDDKKIIDLEQEEDETVINYSGGTVQLGSE
jgi:hypothetical protein